MTLGLEELSFIIRVNMMQLFNRKQSHPTLIANSLRNYEISSHTTGFSKTSIISSSSSSHSPSSRILTFITITPFYSLEPKNTLHSHLHSRLSSIQLLHTPHSCLSPAKKKKKSKKTPTYKFPSIYVFILTSNPFTNQILFNTFQHHLQLHAIPISHLSALNLNHPHLIHRILTRIPEHQNREERKNRRRRGSGEKKNEAFGVSRRPASLLVAGDAVVGDSGRLGSMRGRDQGAGRSGSRSWGRRERRSTRQKEKNEVETVT